MKVLVSIIIVNYNGIDVLPSCVSALERVVEPPFQLIIVDNASTDGSVAYLNGLKNCEIHFHAENSGFAGGNNIGLRLANGEYILLLNSDTIVDPDFLKPLVEYLQRNPKVGIVQGKMFLPNFNNSLDVCGAFFTQLGFLYNYGYYKQDQPLYQKSFPVFTAKGACLMFRKSLISQVGGFLFNEGFFCYYEETEFCHRSWIAGFETHFVHNSHIKHFMGATSNKHQPTGFAVRRFLANQTFSLLSNLSMLSAATILPFYFVLFFANFLASLLKGNWVMTESHIYALKSVWERRSDIFEQRKMVKKMRKFSDWTIFSKVKRTPRLSYFLMTLTGRLANYKDDPA